MQKLSLILFCAASAVVALGACSESTTIDPTADVLPDVPRSTKLNDLTLDQFTQVCEWEFEYNGGASRPCANGGELRVVTVARCVETYEFYGPDSPGYLGAFLQCMVERRRACDTTGILAEVPICREASFSPLETPP